MKTYYSEYIYRNNSNPESYGECTAEQAEEIAEKLESMISARFPGIEIEETIDESKTSGPDAETCEEISRWVEENWLKALELE